MGLEFNSSPALHQMAAPNFQDAIPEAILKKSVIAQLMEQKGPRPFCSKIGWNIFQVNDDGQKCRTFLFEL